MAVNISLTNIESLTNETTAIAALNANYAAITTAFQDVLALDGTSPNQMQNSLDMNSNQIVNLPAPITAGSPLRLQDLASFVGGSLTINTIPAGGTTNQLLAKTSNTSYAVAWASLVPAMANSGTGASNATFWRGDNTWSAPSATVSGITVGTTTVLNSTSGRYLYDNGGVLGETASTGTGNIVLSASPTLTGTITAAAITASGTLTINGSVGGATTTGTGNVVLSASPTLTGVPVLSGQYFRLGDNSGVAARVVNNSNNFNWYFGQAGGSGTDTGTQNTGVGSLTLSALNNGQVNTGVGFQNLLACTTGSQNSCFGAQAGDAITSGGYNTLLGTSTGNSITTGSYNTIVGIYAGSSTLANAIWLGDGQGNARFDYGVTTASTNTITGPLNVTGAVTLPHSIVASLPGTPAKGMLYVVTDGTNSLTNGQTVTNTGTHTSSYLVWYNGSNWTVVGI